jgi:REP element-mobilizing transposase RayT
MSRYRIIQQFALYFVTFTIVDWLPIFVDEEPCKVVTDSLNYCRKQKHLRTNAFVIMPTHLHAIVFDSESDSERLNRTLADMRKNTGQQLSRYCLSNMPSCFGRTLRRAAGKDRQHRLWQGGIHAEAIYTRPFYQEKLDYIHANPVRKGLVRDAHQWRFSSAEYWLNGGESDIILTAVEW